MYENKILLGCDVVQSFTEVSETHSAFTFKERAQSSTTTYSGSTFF
jgi:hypothetical protein